MIAVPLHVVLPRRAVGMRNQHENAAAITPSAVRAFSTAPSSRPSLANAPGTGSSRAAYTGRLATTSVPGPTRRGESPSHVMVNTWPRHVQAVLRIGNA